MSDRLETFKDGNSDIFTGPEEKVNLMEMLLDVIDGAIGSDCFGYFRVLDRGFTEFLAEEKKEELIDIFRKYGACCDCTVGEAMENDCCVKEIVDFVNKIREVKTDA